MTRFDVREMVVQDLDLIVAQKMQRGAVERLKSVDWLDYWSHGFALTATWKGEPIAIGGMAQHLPGIAEAWLLVGNMVGPTQMMYLYRAFDRVLLSELQTAYHRVYCNVSIEFEQARRMARMLGFKFEGCMNDHPRPGKQSILYARTRNGTL